MEEGSEGEGAEGSDSERTETDEVAQVQARSWIASCFGACAE